MDLLLPPLVGIVALVLLGAAVLSVLYHVIRTAVWDGIKDARAKGES